MKKAFAKPLLVTGSLPRQGQDLAGIKKLADQIKRNHFYLFYKCLTIFEHNS